MRLLKFIAKCILAALPFALLIGYTWLNPMGYMDNEYPSWHYVKMVEEGEIKAGDFDRTCLVLGDSRAMADIVVKDMGSSYVNLGMGGATPVEMYFTLKHYIENNGVPSEVMIMFAPFHYSYMDNYKTRTVYFNHLDLIDTFSVFREAKMGSYEAEREPVDEADISYILSSKLRLPNVYMPALINSKGMGRKAENEALFKEQIDNRGHGLYGKEDGCSDLNYEANYTEMKRGREHKVITYYFARLLKLCTDNDIKTVVLQAPMNEASYRALHESYVNEYSSYMRQFERDNKNVTFELEIPCYDNKYFGDSSHLNEKGAGVYTQYILDTYIK
ncbi:MAG: hypothetical protein K5857_01320 [Lachnospiraceae bacterium]|nr:hypothetical protein [Lachnospiraceae bacterium]